MARYLGIFLAAGILILQTACGLTQETSSVTSQEDSVDTNFFEATVALSTSTVEAVMTAQKVEPASSTPIPTISQEDRMDMGLVEATAPLRTTVVGTAIAPSREVGRPSGGNPKIETLLNQLLEVYHRGGLAEAQDFATRHGIVLEEDLVQVELIAVEETAILSLEKTIKTVGGKYQGHYQTLIQALLPIDALETLAERSDVQAIRLPRRPVMMQ
jgi:hypothetical protein